MIVSLSIKNHGTLFPPHCHYSVALVTLELISQKIYPSATLSHYAGILHYIDPMVSLPSPSFGLIFQESVCMRTALIPVALGIVAYLYLEMKKLEPLRLSTKTDYSAP